ncbi:hypothetical protein M8494_09010 [Serratia ureilytica]
MLSRDSLVLERMLIDSDLDLAITDGPDRTSAAGQPKGIRRTAGIADAGRCRGTRRRHAGAVEFYTFSRECSFRLKVDHWLASRGLKPRMTLKWSLMPRWRPAC